MEVVGTESHSEKLSNSQVVGQVVGTALGKGRKKTGLRKTGQ